MRGRGSDVGSLNGLSEPPKFLCDEMLKGLARWLRAAGYDTALAPARSRDRALLDAARAQTRWLLSRDRKLLELRHAADWVRLLPPGSVPEWVCALNRWYGLDWQRAPFSRCLRCNTPLLEADSARRTEVPPQSRGHAKALRWCPHCQQLYWEGSHVRRMRAKLRRWDQTCRDHPG